jgi:hypothetical protein
VGQLAVRSTRAQHLGWSVQQSQLVGQLFVALLYPLTGLLGDDTYLLSGSEENLGITQLELVDLLGDINACHQAFLIIV